MHFFLQIKDTNVENVPAIFCHTAGYLVSREKAIFRTASKAPVQYRSKVFFLVSNETIKVQQVFFNATTSI